MAELIITGLGALAVITVVTIAIRALKDRKSDFDISDDEFNNYR